MPRTVLVARALLCLLLAACRDAGPTLPTPAVADPFGPAAALACTVLPREASLSCATPAGSARTNLILGGQGVRVRLTSSGTVYDSATHVLSSNVTVQNLLPGLMGTPDGTTVYGMNVFFHYGPVTTQGSGVVHVANPDGLGAFTGASQAYFHYGAILASGATSAPREWRFQVDPGVQRFEFLLFVETRLPIETGVLRWTERTLCDSCKLHQILHVGGDTLVIAGSLGGGGLLLRSFDAGATWDTVHVQLAGRQPVLGSIGGTGPHLYALGGPNAQGFRDVLGSEDTGLTWTLALALPVIDPDGNAVGAPPSFEPDALYAAGDSVIVLGIGCADWWGEVCWAWAPFMLYSADGLRTHAWTKLNHPFNADQPNPGDYWLWGAGSAEVYVSGFQSEDYNLFIRAGVSRSTDGGKSWSEVWHRGSNDIGEWDFAVVRAVVATGNGHLWVMWEWYHFFDGRRTTLIDSSTDGGHTWTQVQVPGREYRKMWAAGDDQVYAINANALLRLDGSRWVDQPVGLAGPYIDIAGTSVKNVVIVGGAGRVLRGTR